MIWCSCQPFIDFNVDLIANFNSEFHFAYGGIKLVDGSHHMAEWLGLITSVVYIMVCVDQILSPG